MFKLALLSSFALTIFAYRPLKCPNNYIWSATSQTCIKDCKSQEFAKCPDFYQTKIQANYCGLSQDGIWNQFNYECQACTTPGIIGVTSDVCKQTHKQIITKIHQTQPHHFHEVINPSISPLHPIDCLSEHENRPNQQNCHTINYITIPQLDYCGITYSGEKKGFDLACSACKDLDVEYYYEGNCQKIGVELKSQMSEVIDRVKEKDEQGKQDQHENIEEQHKHIGQGIDKSKQSNLRKI